MVQIGELRKEVIDEGKKRNYIDAIEIEKLRNLTHINFKKLKELKSLALKILGD